MPIKEISEKVVSDAHEQVRAIEQNIEKAAALKISQAEAEARAQIDRAGVTGEQKVEHARRRTRSRAVLAARDELIAAKRDLITQAFAGARAKLNELKEPDNIELLSRLIFRHATGGEQIIFDTGASEAASVRVIDGANTRLHLANRQPVRRATATRGIGRGCVIDSGRVEEDLTFDTLVRMALDEFEADVARTLFGDS